MDEAALEAGRYHKRGLCLLRRPRPPPTRRPMSCEVGVLQGFHHRRRALSMVAEQAEGAPPWMC